MVRLHDPERESARERDVFRVSPDEFLQYPHSAPAQAGARTRRWFRFAARRRRSAAASALREALRREESVGTPFHFLPVALAAGATVYFSLPREPSAWNLLTGSGAILLVLLATFRHAQRWRFPIILAATTIVGMAIAQMQTHRLATPMLGSDVTTRLTGRILAMEERANGRTRYTIEVLETARPRLRHAPEVVRATAAGPGDGFQIGGGIHGVVRLTTPSGPAHPGAYDFAFHSYFDGIGAYGFFLGKPSPATIPAEAGLFGQGRLFLAKLRRTIGDRILEAAPGRAGAVSNALVTGDKAGIPETVNEALRGSGLAHILSISGLHMALVAATVMAGLRLGFAFFPGWAARHPVKKYAAAGALGATGFYLFLAGAGVATQRSFIMLAVMLLALTFDRSAVTMRNLALAAIAVIAFAPHEVAGPGFQMSFAATAALIAVYAAWQDAHRRRTAAARNGSVSGPVPGWLKTASGYLLGIAVTSLVAGFATGIFAAYHFGRIAPYGLLGNLLAMPVVTMVIMPSAVAAIVAMPFALHVLPLKVMAWAVGLVIEIAEWVADLSPTVPLGQMPETALASFVVALVILCLPSTWLRLFSLPLFIAGALIWRSDTIPMAVISEDARQFAILEASQNGTRIHVNRHRPNAFILDQWADAYRGTEVVRPNGSERLSCEGERCIAKLVTPDGEARIAYVSAPADRMRPTGVLSLRRLCAENDLVILAAAPSPQECLDGTPVLTAQMLALKGAAEIRMNRRGRQLTIRHALPGPVRPWLEHRKYSRAARNLGEWKPRRSDQ
ncbi:ComEC/Rec2 family competence protein [Oricola thermophila]|uniref:ComEC/Rec2 family competence protein n=1 Tax=Oricola thermophila TaxID=2742145 RepID=A0A6N1VC39_9HYPH|nr:ComEC/Rec2 family competence protein [Oricola thermophila]QKV18113.1 ComEC/Rec2 family competence protein [Oricola thermophila]